MSDMEDTERNPERLIGGALALASEARTVLMSEETTQDRLDTAARCLSRASKMVDQAALMLRIAAPG